jgi:hypothetical protein
VKEFDPARNPAPTGVLDRLIRGFPDTSYLLACSLLYSVACAALGLALTPSLLLVARLAPLLWRSPHWWRWPSLGVLLGIALFAWGFALLVVVPVFNWMLPTRVRPFHGGYFTIAALPWYLHNGLFYLVRFTFLPFVTLTPMGILFLRAMGMRMGRRPRISTENFSDPCLITLGDDVVIGGSAHVFCHYGGGGKLVIAPVLIESGAVIGEKATVMGDVVVGAGATILPHGLLLPGTRVPARERWGGAPARRISHDDWTAYQSSARGPA